MTTRANVYMEEDAVIVLHHEAANILAVRRHNHIELWDASGETHKGNLAADATKHEIINAAEFWHRGFVDGVRFGRDEAQAKLRAALGLGS